MASENWGSAKIPWGRALGVNSVRGQRPQFSFAEKNQNDGNSKKGSSSTDQTEKIGDCEKSTTHTISSGSFVWERKKNTC